MGLIHIVTSTVIGTTLNALNEQERNQVDRNLTRLFETIVCILLAVGAVMLLSNFWIQTLPVVVCIAVIIVCIWIPEKK